MRENWDDNAYGVPIIPQKADYLKYYKPTSPGLRHKVIPICESFLNLQHKALSFTKIDNAGRNNTGKITVRHKGGRHKARVRIVDKSGNCGSYSVSTVLGISYDPYKSARLALCTTNKHLLFWRLAADLLRPGHLLVGKHIHNKKDFKIGEILPIKYIPEGFKVFNIGTKANLGGNLAKSAGTYGIIIKHNENNMTSIKLSSKKVINISSDCCATIGKASNVLHINRIDGKAGLARWRGIRPTVRGEAMNSVDHPHGGKTAGGVRLKTIYGKLAKFVKTR